MRGVTISLKLDNTCAVAAINNMGSKSVLCDGVAGDIWEWALMTNNWLIASHIAGVLNTVADAESRRSHSDHLEWALDQNVFVTIIRELKCQPMVDLFASRLNYKLKPFYSYRPDPEAAGHDAFTINWAELPFYAFPPIPILPKVLKKISDIEVTGILVVPMWETQTWYPVVMSMLVEKPFLLPRSRTALYHPIIMGPHPMWDRLRLAVCFVSGMRLQTRNFRS